MPNVRDCALIGASADLVGLAYSVGRDGLVVGRSFEAVLRLESDGISRFHARLEHSKQGMLVLSDLGSSNGTYVNGRRVQSPEALEDGDRVRFGPHASFVVRYGVDGGPETLEIVQPFHAERTVELLAKRNQARMLLATREFAEATLLLEEVLAALDAPGHASLAAQEDVAELLTELARCHIGQERHTDAVPLCNRAIALLMGSSSGGKALVRAKFVLGRALLPTQPEDARRIVAGAAESLPSGSALRQELEAWLAVADPATDPSPAIP
ncbi:MAG: FHA domain-containing protein [Nannocystaceae bacterium]|nr:FHA domain-containing protein [bacterium]